ncbi:hypothetical protein BKA62DRAFT_784813 [Auriculariales sp. MPI-PUGE-AT-0066]|nr:hypothetical protein BKA62DRAFT_784813 [Auriculariales sp. MPI-PUGE-AT-0066]
MSGVAEPHLDRHRTPPMIPVDLPFELLAAVLTQAVAATYNDPTLKLPDDCAFAALELSSVCALWRTVSLQTPQMWSYVCFDMDWLMPHDITADRGYRTARVPRPKAYVDFLLLCLNRSARAPLSIRISGQHELTGGSYWPNIVALITPKVETLKIDCGSSEWSHLLSFHNTESVLTLLNSDTPLPLLRTLSVRILDEDGTYHISMDGQWQGCALSAAPNLENIQLEGILPKALNTHAWTRLKTFKCNLRHLDLDISLHDIARLSPNLASLDIRSRGPYGPAPVHIPNLRHIAGDVTRVLQLMQRDTTPRIETLYLCEDREFSNTVFRAFFRISTYESITVIGMPTPQMVGDSEEANKFLNILQFLPNVVRVDLIWNRQSQKLFRLWSQHAYVVQLPKLQHLRVTHAHDGLENCVNDMKTLCSARRAWSGGAILSSTEWKLDWIISGGELVAFDSIGRSLAEAVQTVRFISLCDTDREQYSVAATFSSVFSPQNF